jgi:myo-inositol-1-phosphate synthase
VRSDIRLGREGLFATVEIQPAFPREIRNKPFDGTFENRQHDFKLTFVGEFMHGIAREKAVRVGLVGVGNCASSLVQGLTYYRDAQINEPVPGLMNAEIGGYHVGSIDISAAFDISADKVGRDVSEAIFASPNNTARFARVPHKKVTVQRGPTLDGLGKYLKDEIAESEAEPVSVAQALEDSRTDVLVSYLPVGSQQATEY